MQGNSDAPGARTCGFELFTFTWLGVVEHQPGSNTGIQAPNYPIMIRKADGWHCHQSFHRSFVRVPGPHGYFMVLPFWSADKAKEDVPLDPRVPCPGRIPGT